MDREFVPQTGVVIIILCFLCSKTILNLSINSYFLLGPFVFAFPLVLTVVTSCFQASSNLSLYIYSLFLSVHVCSCFIAAIFILAIIILDEIFWLTSVDLVYSSHFIKATFHSLASVNCYKCLTPRLFYAIQRTPILAS